VQAYMSLGQNDLATTSLVKLLQTRSGGEGASIVHDLMQRLNGELDQAQQANDRKRMMQIAANRATLSGFLVEWSKNNPDQNIRRYAHRYAIFDAAAKRLAADLIEDPNERLKALQGTLALYRSLENAKPPTTAPAAEETDPQVALGIGLIAYDLGDYSEAQRRLGQLLIDRKLGSPTVVVTENGAQRPVENDAYWEATLKLLRSNLELWKTSRTDPAAVAGLEQSRTHLNQLYIQWGEKVGGAKWHGEFEKLRAELMTAAH